MSETRESTPQAARPVWTLVRAMIGCGVVAGALELALVVVQRILDPRVPLESIRTNRHFVWMIPLGDLAVFAGLSLVLALVARRLPVAARWLSTRGGCALTALAGLLAVESLHPAASLALASGVGLRAGGFLDAASPAARRRLGFAVAALGLLLAAVGGTSLFRTLRAESTSGRPVAPPGVPNVLWVVLDNVRAQSLSLYGYDRATSPNLERLARRGVCFTQARSPAPWTLPSHGSMFTGRWPHELSVDWDRGLDDAHRTIAEHLASRGYVTGGFVGNTYYANVRYGVDRGFDRYEDFYENLRVTPYEVVRSASLGRRLLQAVLGQVTVASGGAGERKLAEMINRDALEWIDRRPRDRPFFAFLNYFDAHTPFMPPEGPSPRFGHALLTLEERTEKLVRFKRMLDGKPRAQDGPPDVVRREATEVFLDTYESCIAYMDLHLGKLIDSLESRGLMDDTLVVVTSDHGEHFMEHGFYGHGLSLYDREVRVPLVIVPPRRNRPDSGVVVEKPVTLRDLAATSLDLIGLAEASPLPGASLSPLWQGVFASRPSPSPAFSEVARHRLLPPVPGVPATQGWVKSLLAGDRVYIRNGDGREELYDLAADPLESRNLLTDPGAASFAARHRRTIDRILADESAEPAPEERLADEVDSDSSGVERR